MVQPSLFFVAMIAGAVAAAAPVPQPAEMDLTLDEVRSLAPEVRTARLNALVGGGYYAVESILFGWGLLVTYRSPARAAGPRTCEATEVTFTWGLLPARPGRDGRSADTGAAPLRLENRSTRSVYRQVDGRRLRPGSSRLQRACDRIEPTASFVSAPSAEAFQRAERILAAVQRELRRRPVVIEVDCRGWPDCRDRILRASLHDLQSISDCIEWDSRQSPPNCLRFNLRPMTGPTMVATQGFEADVDPGDQARVRRLRWRAMMHTS